MLGVSDMARKGRKQQPSLNPDFRVIQIENPHWSRAHDGDRGNPRFIPGVVSLRESAIVALYVRGAIDDAQYKAAEKFRRLFETLGGSGARSIDTTRDFVDGGKFPDPIGEAQIDAGKQLAAAYEALTKEYGLYAWRLVSMVCGEGRSLMDLSQVKRERLTLADNLRRYLDLLCVHWCLANRA